MIWLGVRSKGISPSVILDKGKADHQQSIVNILPIVLENRSKVYEKN